MAKWMVKEGFVTEEAAREAGIQFEQPELEENSSARPHTCVLVPVAPANS